MDESMGMPPVSNQVPQSPVDEAEENPSEEVSLQPGWYHLSNVEFFPGGAGTEPLTGYNRGTMTIFNDGHMSFDGFSGTDSEKRFPVRGWHPIKVDGKSVTMGRQGQEHLPDAVITIDADWFQKPPF